VHAAQRHAVAVISLVSPITMTHNRQCCSFLLGSKQSRSGFWIVVTGLWKNVNLLRVYMKWGIKPFLSWSPKQAQWQTFSFLKRCFPIWSWFRCNRL